MSKAADIADRGKAGTLPADWEDEAEVIQEPRHRLPRMADAFAAANAMANSRRASNPLKTGFADIDDGLRHLGPKEVTMLAADSGVGKSTLSTQTALHVANCGYGVVYFNLEMSSEMYALRTGANFTELPTQRAAIGELNGMERVQFARGLDELKAPAQRIVMGNASEHKTIPAIKKHVADAKAELQLEGTPLRLVVVDHVLMVRVSGVRSDDKDALGMARADMLKDIAESFGVHVLALVHVTREGSKTGKMPTKNDLASSAWFDRHADNILIFHQRRDADGVFDKGSKAVLACQKSRWGSPFRAELEYRRGFFFPWSLDPQLKRLSERVEKEGNAA